METIILNKQTNQWNRTSLPSHDCKVVIFTKAHVEKKCLDFPVHGTYSVADGFRFGMSMTPISVDEIAGWMEIPSFKL